MVTAEDVLREIVAEEKRLDQAAETAARLRRYDEAARLAAQAAILRTVAGRFTAASPARAA